jgi:RNA polymerase sigma-70 factor (ECF subfamily)
VSDELKCLVRRCLDGQAVAQIDLVQRFQGPVFGFCMSMLRQRQDAEDCTQETLIRVLKNLHRWDSTRKFEPWLFTIAGNRCRTRLARRGRQPVVHSLDVPVADDWELRRDAALLSEEVDLALEGLRSEYREVFTRFHRCQMSYEEISEAMGIPLGTVKTWVHRARRDIVARLLKRGVVEEPNSELQPVREPDPALAG